MSRRGVYLALVLMALTLTLPHALASEGGVEDLIKAALRSYEYCRVLELAERISSLGPRAPGYPGYYATANLIISAAKSLNLKVIIQNFTMLVPIEVESYVEVIEPLHLKLRAYALWPNGGIAVGTWAREGYAAYVELGDLDDFDGKSVNGSIVLMEYGGSGYNWVNALRFGAKAVVYLFTPGAEGEALKKFDPILPIPFPCVYLGPEESDKLRALLTQGPVKLRVYVNMELREVVGHNILVEIPGETSPNEIILLVAHFDSWCVVPSLSNSTEEAISTAMLLELMKYLARNRPARTAWLLFTSGHWNGLAGPRAFVRWHILQDSSLTRGEKLILCVMGVDISADLPIASLVYVGHFYQAGSSILTAKLYGVRNVVASYARIAGEYLNETGLPEEEGLRLAIRNLGLVRHQDLTEGPEWMWASTMSKPYVLDTEPFTIAGMAAFTFKTSFSFKPLEGEPISDLRYVRSRFRDYIVPQLASALAIAIGLLNEPEIRTMPRNMILPTRLHPLLYWGFIDLSVKVLEYNVTEGWYNPVPHAIVRVSRSNAYNYPFVWMIAKADHEGSALVYGITPQTFGAWYVDAYKILNDSWAIMPAWGLRSTGPTWVTALVPRVYTTVNVKPLKMCVLTDLFNPRIMRRTIEDPRFSTANVLAPGSAWPSLYETTTGMVPLYHYTVVSDKRGLGLAGYTPLSKLTLTLGIGGRWPVAVAEAAGASPVLSSLSYAESLYHLAQQRYSTLSTREVRKLSADLMLEYARAHLDKAASLLESKRYGDAYRHSLAAWSYSARAYADEVMPLYEESIRSVLAFAPLIIVSAYFFERLLLRGGGVRRILYTIGLEVALFIAFAIVHPAFWIIPSTLLASLCIGLLILMAVVLWIFYREARDILSEVSAKILGRHEVTKETIPVILMTLSLSIENMRRRPLRTILTIVPVTVFSMAMVSLASISPYTAIMTTMTGREAPYWGLLVKSFYGVLESTLDDPTVELIRALVGERGVVCPRLWYYPPAVIGYGPYGLIISSNGSARVPAVVGLTSVEARKLVRRALVKGTIFFDDHQLAILLPSTLAERLKVDVGDEVEFLGMRLVVTGIFSEDVLEATRDFDGLSLAPMDSTYYPQLHGFAVKLPATVYPLPLAWKKGVVIMPGGLVKRLGGFISSIGIVLKPNITYAEVEAIAKRIAYALDAPCYASDEARNVVAYSKVPTFSAVGWEMMLVPFVLTSLNIVVTLLGSVKERTSEIYTYTSVGLSPGGAMLMFIVEFAVYGFLGAMVGYFAGWAASKILRWMGMLPTGFVFNYASVSIVAVIIMVILSTLIAAAYPSYLASRLVTPSFERKWRMPRAPRGTIWEIPLPFRVPSGREAQAILLYLQEYYRGAGSMKRLYRVTTDPRVSREERKLSFNVWLYPFDAATEQEVELYFTRERRGGWRAILRLRLVKGLRRIWVSGSQYSFLNDLRKQLLLWRTLPASERKRYLRMLQEQNP